MEKVEYEGLSDELSEKECCLFSCPKDELNEVIGNRDIEELDSFGGEGEGYSWNDGSQKLCRCRNCGALLLEYRIKFLSMGYDDDSITYVYYFPVKSFDEALEFSNKHISSTGLNSSYGGKKIWFNRAKLCWERQ